MTMRVRLCSACFVWRTEITICFIHTDQYSTIAKPLPRSAYKRRRVGIGKIAENGPPGSLDAQGNIYAYDMFIEGKALRDIFYPIGAIYQSTVNTDPSSFIGGTWERFGNGRVLVGVDEADSDFSTPNKTGGAKTNTHSHLRAGDGGSISTVANTPGGYVVSNRNSVSSETISILQPYATVYMWRRTA